MILFHISTVTFAFAFAFKMNENSFSWDKVNTFIKLNPKWTNLENKYSLADEQHSLSAIRFQADFLELQQKAAIAIKSTTNKDNVRHVYKYYNFMSIYPIIHKIEQLDYLQEIGNIIMLDLEGYFKEEYGFDIKAVILRYLIFFKIFDFNTIIALDINDVVHYLNRLTNA